MVAGWEAGPSDQPLPPINGQVVSPFLPGVLDIRWDDPNLLAGNASFSLVGVNIYRSAGSDRGPYFRLNRLPIGGTFYRDQTNNTRITKERVAADAWVFQGDAPNDRRYVFRTKHPAVKQDNAAPFEEITYANTPSDVAVFINGVQVPVHGVFGRDGEITLINVPALNVVTEELDGPTLPTETSDVVEVSYFSCQNFVQSGMELPLHYRLTTVVLDSDTGSGYRETSLGYCPPLSNMTVETMDYIWREAVRRNQWILQQGGERVKIFIRKVVGIPCTCGLEGRTREFSKMPRNRCTRCYGTGFLGGYEGPYSAILAPDDAERRFGQRNQGRTKEHTYEVWTGPSPVLTQRDFVTKQTNERYSIGPVRRPTNRGNLLQQHFNIAYLEIGDIRYQVPIDNIWDEPWPETRDSIHATPTPYVDGGLPDEPPYPANTDPVVPMETEKDGIPDTREQRGRTRVWENTSY